MQHRQRQPYGSSTGGAPHIIDLSTDLPQGFVDGGSEKVKVEGKGRAHSRRLEKSNDTTWIWTFVVLTLVVIVAAYFLVQHHEKIQMDHLRRDIIHDQVEPLSREWEEKYANLEEENARLKKFQFQVEELEKENKQLQNKAEMGSNNEESDKKVEYLTNYKSTIQKRIAAMSKRLLLDKFGEGPHKVEINLAFAPEFPKAKPEEGDTGRIVIELAPVEAMPHVVHWFLETVSEKLYDGCSFHRNAGHVVQGGPAPNFQSPPNPQLNKRFQDAGLHSILFQEYSPTFPHEKYTLGFAGRPGGPDFYISTKDNTKLHGPGGQRSYDDPTEADSCFAKVVEGFDVVDRMELGPVKPGGYRALQQNVAITSMKLLQE